MSKIYDIYFRYPLTIDLLIIIIVWLINSYLAIVTLDIEESTINSIIPSLIDTSISLAGFILAALTIIVTFKSNLKAKGIKDAQNAFEMILASSNYKGIVNTFKGSILELTILSVVLYCMWLCKDGISASSEFKALVSGVIVLGLSIGRSLMILFKVLKIETK